MAWRGPGCPGKFEESIEQFELALRLSPLDPRAFLAYHGLAYAHFLAGRYSKALEWAVTGIRRWPQFVQLHRQTMAAFAMLDRFEEAAESREAVLRLSPTLTISELRRTSMLSGIELEKVVTAWRRAGMPE